MQFTDLKFLFVFFPFLFIVYYIIRPKYRQFILLLFSLLFYTCGSPEYILYLCLSIAINICIAYGIFYLNSSQRKIPAKFLLTVGIIFNVSVLVCYKYINFIIKNINVIGKTDISQIDLLIPLGLSYYTFKVISYLSDTYTGKIKKISIFQSAAYLSFFGQIQSGPISRYEDFFPPVRMDIDLISSGIVRFMLGFSKKTILANVLNNITVEIFDQTTSYSAALAWLGAICFSLQLYYDFSGYSDMAIGIGNMLGYKCPENFIFPYTSKSVSEFWRRWHISLGSWFRDYVYIPMGGSRVGKKKLYINLFTVWLLTGLWHGAAWRFVLWGLINFVFIAFEKTVNWPKNLPNKFCKILYQIFTLLIIVFQWVIFRSNRFSDGISYLITMCFGVFDSASPAISSARALFLAKDYGVFIVAAILFATPLIKGIENFCNRNRALQIVYDSLYILVVSILFLLALSFIISGLNNPFMYAIF